MRFPKTRTLALVAAGLLVFGACSDTEEPDSAAETETEATDESMEESGTLAVTAVDNSFDPSTLSAAAGAEVTVELTNDGSNPHTFTIDDLEVDTGSIAGGESGSATFTMGEESVTFYCAIHGEATMSGTIEAS